MLDQEQVDICAELFLEVTNDLTRDSDTKAVCGMAICGEPICGDITGQPATTSLLDEDN